MKEDSEEGEKRKLPSLISYLMGKINDIIESIRVVSKISEMEEVARRYVVTNSFDSLLMILGVLMGSFISGLDNPSIIINTILGGAIAVLISGTVGTYLTERAERTSRIKELEVAVFMDLDKTLIGKAENLSAIMVAIASGLVPFLAIISLIMPFYLSARGILNMIESYIISLGETLSILFLMGAFLGSLSGENKLLYGLFLVGMGVVIVLIMLWLGVK